MVSWEKTNICRVNPKKTHMFSVKYKNYNYCEYCGDCQALGGFKISEDLLEHLKEEQDALHENMGVKNVLD